MVLVGEFGKVLEEFNPDNKDKLDHIIFCGEEFKIAEEVGTIALMKFSYVAQSGFSVYQTEGLAAMYEMIKDCLLQDYEEDILDEDGQPTGNKNFVSEFQRFERLALKNKVGGDVLFELCTSIYATVSGRPTTKQSSSLVGLPSATPNLNTSSGIDQEFGTPVREISLNQLDALRQKKIMQDEEVSPGVIKTTPKTGRIPVSAGGYEQQVLGS